MTQTGDRALHVVQLLEHMRTGGAERLVADLVPALRRSGVRVKVCLYRDIGPLGEELAAAGIPLVFIRKTLLSGRIPARLAFLRPLATALESPLFVWRLGRWLRSEGADVLHCHMFSASLWGSLAARLAAGRTSVVITEHTLRSGPDSLKHRIAGRLLPSLADAVTAVGEQLARGLAARWRLPPRSVRAMPNGVPLDPGLPAPAGLPGGAPLIAAIGRLVPVKRIDLLLHALRRCLDGGQRLICLIIGEGPERQRLEGLSADLGLGAAVRFLGERRDVRALLPYLDLVVNCSDREGLSVTLLEAMAASRPVVATDVGSTREIVHDGRTGILVPPGHAEALSRAVSRMLADPDNAAECGRRGRALVEAGYSIDAAAARWHRLYRALHRRRRGGSR